MSTTRPWKLMGLVALVTVGLGRGRIGRFECLRRAGLCNAGSNSGFRHGY